MNYSLRHILLLNEGYFNMPDDYVPDDKDPRDPAFTGSDDKTKEQIEDAVEKFANDENKEYGDTDITKECAKYIKPNTILYNEILQLQSQFEDFDQSKPADQYDFVKDFYVDKDMLDSILNKVYISYKPQWKENFDLYYKIMTEVFDNLSDDTKDRIYNG